jgi:DUF1680 family protein
MLKLCILGMLAVCACAQAQETEVRRAALGFPPQDVRLLPGPFRDAMELDRRYLDGLPTDRLLHNFRINAGVSSNAEPLGGWEAPGCELRGHFVGHYLSACALMYAATNDERLRDSALKVVAGLAGCQAKSGYLSAFPEDFIERVETGKKVWAPWYTLHKIMAGLLDMYLLAGSREALDVATRMAVWAKARTDRLDDTRMQEMLKVEFGGMNEVLLNLFAATGNRDFLTLARRFEQRAFLDPLAGRRDELKGLHANTNIPKVVGAARSYELTGDESYRTIAEFFWNQIVSARSYCTGGTSNYEYWRQEPYHLADDLSAETHENCCTYNMLKLTDHIFSWTADPRAADYYERALFNGILPTQKPGDGGAIMYYVPLHSGLFKMFGLPDSSYYCCNGTGIESFAKLGNHIYYRDEEGIFVNLFIASEVSWKERGIRLRQETKFPEEETAAFSLVLDTPGEFSLRIRIPSWLAQPPLVKLNGTVREWPQRPAGYLTLKRVWKNGDRVELALPMDFHLARMPDDSALAAVMYGPLVCAGSLGTEGMTQEMKSGYGWPDVDRMVSRGAAALPPVLVPPGPDPNTWIRRTGEPLVFRTLDAGRPQDVTLVPFYKLFGERYAVYWNLSSARGWDALRKARERLPDGVIDSVAPGDRSSERFHNFQAYRFQSGERSGRSWVSSASWFRYDLDMDPHQPMALRCTYWCGDSLADFEIQLDGQTLETRSPGAGRGSDFCTREYRIPEQLVHGTKRIAVTFNARGKGAACEFYGCAIIHATTK